MDADSNPGARIDLKLADNANRRQSAWAMDGQLLVSALVVDT